MLSISSRWKHFAAMALLGDAVMAVVRPEHSASAWNIGPQPWQALMKGLRSRPNLTRAIGAVQAAAVIYWIAKQESDEKTV